MPANEFMTIASTDQGTAFVEAYGLLLASVLLAHNGNPPRAVAVASAQAGDGCSTTALNLAMMMARTGRPTVIVDANLREPELHKAFGLSHTPGLADVLTGKAELNSVVVATKIPHLSFVPAGRVQIPAQALLVHPALATVFNDLRERFDLVVIDTAPMLSFPDTLHIGKEADGVLLVVSPQGASRREQQEMRRLLERVEARILGTVLNRARGRAMAGA